MKDFHFALGHEAIASTTKLARFKRAKPNTSWQCCLLGRLAEDNDGQVGRVGCWVGWLGRLVVTI